MQSNPVSPTGPLSFMLGFMTASQYPFTSLEWLLKFHLPSLPDVSFNETASVNFIGFFWSFSLCACLRVHTHACGREFTDVCVRVHVCVHTCECMETCV